MTLRRVLLLLVALLVPGQLKAQDSVPRPQVFDSAAASRDSAAAAKAAEIERARQDSILYGKPPVSPMGALFRSMLIPGWGQAKLNRKLTGALFIAWEGVTLGMSLKSSHELSYLRRTRSGSVEAKRQERQDWLVLLGFNHLFSGIEAYVSAHLWDFPDDLKIQAAPMPGGGFGGSVSVPFRLP
jgi:hypothetical protein